jgi:1-deoxyxylulose-5-phosphate synthase
LCQKYDLAILPWSPLAMGILAGRYTETGNYPEDSRAHRWDSSMVKARITQGGIEVGKAVSKLAQERGLTASQLSLLWIKDQPGITSPIIGPRTLAHLEDALGILDKSFDDADRLRFDELVHPGNAVADFHNSNDWMKARILS